MNDNRRREILERLAALRPAPQSELHWKNPFELLIAVMLSAQTTDRKVNAVTPALFERAPTAAAMAAMTPGEVEGFIRTLGLYRSKARPAVEAPQLLVRDHQGEVPRDFKALTALPGVGEKTAKVVLNVAFGEPLVAVDTHIFRVARRTGLVPAASGSTPSAVGSFLERHLPAALLTDAHHWLLLHGRYCCTARKPHCADCPIADLCEFKEKTSSAD